MPLDSEGAEHKALPVLAQRWAYRELRTPGAQVPPHKRLGDSPGNTGQCHDSAGSWSQHFQEGLGPEVM